MAGEQDTYDYIIVGAGSAGCVLARRLSEDSDTSVLVVEAGGWDYSLWIHMPAAFSKPLQGTRHNWAFRTEPEPGMDNRVMDCPRGRVLGGSSSINGMAYVRGHAYDYDRWAAETGDSSWAYRQALSYFKKAETRVQGGDQYRGDSGPLFTTSGSLAGPLNRTFVEAGIEAGYPRTDDMNGYQQEGFGVMDRTTYKGRRWSTAMAYLRPALKRANLTLMTRTHTLAVEQDQGRATGITVAQGSETRTLRANKDVILAAGAVGSPHLLMLSGIGPGQHLREHGIDVTKDLPGVGQNLQDHLELYIQYICKEPVTLYPVLKPWNQARIGIEWLARQTGLGATNHFEAGGFIRSESRVSHPDIQYHFLPMAITYDGRTPGEGHGYQAHVGPMRPTSRGEITLKSADPAEAPRIRFNYMTTERDRWEMRASIRATREIMNQPAFDKFNEKELSPGLDVTSDKDLDAFVRQHAESAYHPSCTCAMGKDDDPGAVVDSQARVFGLQGLRVVDASIMPSIASGNLNAPTIMLAEKLADVIRGRDLAAASDAPVYPTPATVKDDAQRPLKDVTGEPVPPADTVEP